MGYFLNRYLPSHMKNRKEFYLDNDESDLPIVDKRSIARTSICIAPTTGRKWILNSTWTWVEQTGERSLEYWMERVNTDLAEATFSNSTDMEAEISIFISNITGDTVSNTVTQTDYLAPIHGTMTEPTSVDGYSTFSYILTNVETSEALQSSTQTIIIPGADYLGENLVPLITELESTLNGISVVGYKYMSSIQAEIESICGDISYVITQISYTPDIAGTTEDPDGTDGSYQFIVTLTNSVGDSLTTTSIDCTLLATPLDLSGDFYDATFEVVDETMIATLSLSPEFETALETDTAYSVWSPGDPVPAPPTYEGAYSIKWDYLFSELDVETLDMTNFGGDASDNVISCYGMFQNCAAKVIAFDNLVLGDCTTMAFMFDGCSNLEEVDLDYMDATNLLSVAGMFRNCTVLDRVNLFKAVIPGPTVCTNFTQMFYGCSAIETISLHYLAPVEASIQNMCYGCTALTALDISYFGTLTTHIQAFYYTSPKVMCFNEALATQLESATYTFNTADYEICKYYEYCTEDYDYYTFTSDWVGQSGYPIVRNMARLAMNTSVNSTTAIENWDFRNATNVTLLFLEASGLASLDISRWRMPRVSILQNLFYGSDIVNVVFGPDFDGSAVTTVSSMFTSCLDLVSVDFGGFDLTNLSSVSGFFLGCSSLETVDLSNLDMTDMDDSANWSAMFRLCTGVTAYCSAESLDFFNSLGYTDDVVVFQVKS